MKRVLTAVLLIWGCIAQSQNTGVRVVERMKLFHQSMVNDKSRIGEYIDDSLSYGHSNGWVENRDEFYNNMGVKISYHSYKEDSIKVRVNRNTAHARFIADIDATLDGKRTTYHLKVLEVWVKRNKNWKLFARQAFR